MADTITIPSPRVFLSASAPATTSISTPPSVSPTDTAGSVTASSSVTASATASVSTGPNTSPPAAEELEPRRASPKPARPAKSKQQHTRRISSETDNVISTGSVPSKLHGGAETCPAVSNACGVDKKKQTKSRNGCVTCKTKRLKCDEKKPTCAQCARRNVECGGYKKEFKWRPFAETAFITAHPPVNNKRKDSVAFPLRGPRDGPKAVSLSFPSRPADLEKTRPAVAEETQRSQAISAQHMHSPRRSPEVQACTQDPPPQPSSIEEIFVFEDAPPDLLSSLSIPHAGEELTATPSEAKCIPESGNMLDTMPDEHEFSSSDDLNLIDPCLLFARNDGPALQTPTSFDEQPFLPEEGEDIEEIFRTRFPGYGGTNIWHPALPEYYASSMSNVFVDSTFNFVDGMLSIPRSIDLGSDAPETLCARFDRQTCGILSVKDGPSENPWRTMIWPLARDSPALYHAIASMTSFHTSRFQPEYRLQGIDHMRASIEALATGIETMQFDTAIATTLALAFAESWDQHTSTGINHIKGAKVLVNQALTYHERRNFPPDKLERLRFLTNAWVYMDVLARITSDDDDETNDFDAVLSNPFATNMFGCSNHVDPLMGAASTLFPIVGRVANLVRKVRRTERNSPTIISSAMDLKNMLRHWEPAEVDETIEDPTVEIEHSIQTAEAYRWATLLYLHQAIPEIPSESSSELARRVMVYLSTVPLESRTVIVHIYPLMAASCEAYDQEDRQWVHERWLSMAQRMKLGIIDRCVEIVNEVWKRRDAYEVMTTQHKARVLQRSNAPDINVTPESDPIFPLPDLLNGRKRRSMSGAFDLLRGTMENRPRKAVRGSNASMEYAFTARGQLHWLGVMKEWGWEVLLG